MVIHKGPAFQPALPWLFALLAAGGLLAFLSWWAFLLASHLSDMDPSEELVFAWAIMGLLGLAAALVFGTMALLCVVAALFFTGQR